MTNLSALNNEMRTFVANNIIAPKAKTEFGWEMIVVTTPTLKGGRKNPLAGMVKVALHRGFTFANYGNAVANKGDRNGFQGEDHTRPQKDARYTYVRGFFPVLKTSTKDNDVMYLCCTATEKYAVKAKYYLNGVEIPEEVAKAEIVQRTKVATSTQIANGLTNATAVIYINPKVENIVLLRQGANGNAYFNGTKVGWATPNDADKWMR